MNRNYKSINMYCTGCGLCKSIDYSIELNVDDKGFIKPSINIVDVEGMENICPAFNKYTNKYDYNNPWGHFISVYLGYCKDGHVRDKASSGGVLTGLLCWLLDNKKIDGVIHCVMDPVSPWKTITVCSKTSDEVKSRCGSRYSQSSPLTEVFKLMEKNKKYAFVGKPCDVSTLKSFMDLHLGYNDKILYCFSFFCAGIPSEKAEFKLLKELNSSVDTVSDLQYRGNGWPGFTTVTNNDNSCSKMEYEKSWGQILGRDICKFCRFCMDGVGEFADISCGDAWYIKDGKPDFSEQKGRNVVFSRTQAGQEILQGATDEGYLCLTEFTEYEKYLPVIQKYQYERRVTMFAKILALKICFRPTPNYSMIKLFGMTKLISIKRQVSIFKGTIKRVIERKL